MQRRVFKRLYYNYTNKQVASMIGVKSDHTVISYAKHFGLKLKGKGRRTIVNIPK